MINSNPKVDEIFERKSNGDDEEILHPSWRKTGFGIQLEAPSRVTLNVATVSKTVVNTATGDEDSRLNQPFLPSTYLGGEMSMGNPWNQPNHDEPSIADSKILSEKSVAFSIKELEKIAQPMGFIPYVEETPPNADSKNESTDISGSKLTSALEDKKEHYVADSKGDQAFAKDESTTQKFGDRKW